MNTIVTFGTLAVAMAVGFVLTAPDIPVLPFVVGLAAIALIMPIVIYPFTFTMWLAFDLAVHVPDEVELLEAAVSVTAPEASSSLPPE